MKSVSIAHKKWRELIPNTFDFITHLSSLFRRNMSLVQKWLEVHCTAIRSEDNRITKQSYEPVVGRLPLEAAIPALNCSVWRQLQKYKENK